MLQVTSLTSSIFSNKTVAPLLLKANTPSQISILLNPISSTFVNLTPFNFGSRVMFNTLGTVLPILLQFFVSLFFYRDYFSKTNVLPAGNQRFRSSYPY